MHFTEHAQTLAKTAIVRLLIKTGLETVFVKSQVPNYCSFRHEYDSTVRSLIILGMNKKSEMK